jgi:TPR repeat protein
VPKDEVKATSLYAQACEHHNVTACGNYGWHLYKGIGIAADKAKGKEILTKSCALKNNWACTKAKLAK